MGLDRRNFLKAAVGAAASVVGADKLLAQGALEVFPQGQERNRILYREFMSVLEDLPAGVNSLTAHAAKRIPGTPRFRDFAFCVIRGAKGEVITRNKGGGEVWEYILFPDGSTNGKMNEEVNSALQFFRGRSGVTGLGEIGFNLVDQCETLVS